MRKRTFLSISTVLAFFPPSTSFGHEIFSTPEDHEPVRGLVRAVDEARVSTDLSARIIKIGRREGESFKKGDILISFDCLQFKERLNSAKADEQLQKVALENVEKLQKGGAVGRFEVEQARFKLEKAEAEAAALAAYMRDCSIAAPFSGRVAELTAHAFETPRSGDSFLRIVGTENLEVDLIIPSRFLKWIKSGVKFKVLIDETGNQHEAIVQHIGAVVDSSSQTVKIVAAFRKPIPEVLPGMSLTANFGKFE